MNYLALIILPEKDQRSQLRTYLDVVGRWETVDFDSFEPAIQWLKEQKRSVHAVFVPWQIGRSQENAVSVLRDIEQTRNSLIFMITTPQDQQWLQTIFGAGDLIDSILIKPFRYQVFVERIEQLMKSGPTTSRTALLVEDNEDARATLREYLTNYGFSKIYEAPNGARGFEILAERMDEISLVVSDWQMPSMTGIELLRKIRLTPKMSRLPFVMVTSQSSIEHVKYVQSINNGANGYLMKPFNLKVFKTHVEQVFSQLDSEKKAEQFLVQGRTLLAQGDALKALAVLQEGVKILPDSEQLLEATGDAYCALGERDYLDTAASVYETALKAKPLKTHLVLKAFEVYMTLGKRSEAIRVLKGHIQNAGFDDQLRTKLGKAYIENGDYGAGCVELRRALDINPSNSQAQSLLQVASTLGQPEKKVA